MIEYGQPSRNVHEHSKPASISESLQPCTVSSEAIGSIRSRTVHTSAKSQGDVTTCVHCGAQFSGRYRRGNCSRHVRQQHSGKSAQLSSDCICRVCKKRFNRQDARRKHEWKKHQLQDTRPFPRQQAAAQDYEASHTGTYDTYSEQGTLTCTRTLPKKSTAHTPYMILAHNAFAVAKAELSDESYVIYCDAFLDCCARIVEELQNKQSVLSPHSAYSQTNQR